MATKNLKPLRPTVTQVKRVLHFPVGSGFFIYKLDDKRVEVVEFTVDESTGDLKTFPEGDPLTYYIAPDGKETVEYRIVKKGDSE